MIQSDVRCWRCHQCVSSSTVVESQNSASEELSAVTRSVVESMLDVEPAYMPSSLEQMSSVVNAGSPAATVDALGPEVERLSATFLSSKSADICVETVTTVEDGCVTVAAGPVVVAVQTEGGLCSLNELIDHVKHCVFCKLLRSLVLVIFPCFEWKQMFFVSLIRDFLQ